MTVEVHRAVEEFAFAGDDRPFSTLEFLAARVDRGKQVDAILDFPPSGIFGKTLDGFHGEFLGGNGVKLG